MSKSEFRAESIYDYPPVDGKQVGRSVMRPGDGSAGEGKPRMWDGLSRPVEFHATQYYGFPHYWPVLEEADNPFLAEEDGNLTWVKEYDDPARKRRRWRGDMCDSFQEAKEMALAEWEETFNDGKHHLVPPPWGEDMPKYQFIGRREGD